MATLTKSKQKTTVSKGRLKLPVKRSINLAEVGEKPMNLKIGIPSLILILVVAALIGKFGVADRIIALNQAQAEVNAVKSQLSACYDKLEEYEEIEEIYAHYTYSDMTQEELSLVDRTTTVKMIERVVLPASQLRSWSISKNMLSLSLSANTLQDINLIAQRLESEDIVDYCSVTSAATDSGYIYNEDGILWNINHIPGDFEGEYFYGVTAQITAYLFEEAE